MEALTKKEQKLLDIITEYFNTKGYPPTVRELLPLMNLTSTSSVHAQLNNLKRKGYLVNDPTKPRTLALANHEQTHQDMVQVPILGTVAAGQPILAQENIEDYFPLPANMLHNLEVFLLRIKGESMIKAGIYPKDLLLVAKQDTAENGEIVVAMTESGEATVKRLYVENDHVRLQPENDTMEPIILDSVTILGKAIGIMRLM